MRWWSPLNLWYVTFINHNTIKQNRQHSVIKGYDILCIFKQTNKKQEFIPRGRKAYEDHPGPLVTKKQINIPSEHLLLHRLQNVNISSGDSGVEGWVIREMATECSTSSTVRSPIANNSPTFVTENDLHINSEEELYFKGHTAVWSKGIVSEDGEVLPRICFTCDTPIKHAFFCPTNFVKTKDPDKRPCKRLVKEEDPIGICLIGTARFSTRLGSMWKLLSSSVSFRFHIAARILKHWRRLSGQLGIFRV